MLVIDFGLLSFYLRHGSGGIPVLTWSEPSCRASAATTFGSYGVIGTTEGTLYVWDIVSGKKVVKLPELEGKSIFRYRFEVTCF